MEYLIFSVKDIVRNEFCAPRLAYNKEDMLRQFRMTFGKLDNAGDYQLFTLGKFNSTIGCIVPNIVEGTPVDNIFICNGIPEVQ